MSKRFAFLCVLALLCALPVHTFAQGGRYDTWAVDSNNHFVASPTVRVCTYSAPWSSATAYVTGNTVTYSGGFYTALASSTNVTPGTDPTKWQSGNCTPLASIYADKALATAQANPFSGDIHGNYGWFAAPGTYTAQVNGYAYSVTVASGFSSSATFSDPDFSIVPAPDTQCYTYPPGSDGLPSTTGGCPKGNGLLASGTAQFSWIATNAVSLNIKAAIQLGDLVDRAGSPQNWANVDTMLAPIWASTVPFIAAIGNHDWDQVGTDPQLFGTPSSRLTTQYHAHIASIVGAKSYFGGSWTTAPDANYWIKFTNGTQHYGILALEDCPRPGATAWAASVMAANPTYKFIVVTHRGVYWDNQFMTSTSNQSCSSDSFTDGAQEGIDLWNNFLSVHDDQVVLFLSGHIGGSQDWGDVGRISLIGSHGNVVPAIAQNYQFSDVGGSGYLRIYKFHPSTATIDVQTYSPAANAYQTQGWNQFTVSYGSVHAQGAMAVSGDVSGTNGVFTGSVHAANFSANTFNRYFKNIYGINPGDDGVSFTVRRSNFNSTTTLNAPGGTGGLLLNGDSGTGVSLCDGTGTANYVYGCTFEFAPGSPTINYRTFSNTASVSNFTIRRYRGTQAAPLPLLANDAAYRISVAPYDGGASIATPNEAASFQAVVSTDLTTGNHGIGWSWCTTPNGSVIKQCSLSNNPDGSLTESAYFSSARYIGAAANQPNTGVYNMAHSEKAAWRNNANTGDITIGPSGATDVLTVTGGTLDAAVLSGTVPAASIAQLPKVVANVSTGAQTASIGTTTLTTPAAAGTYRVSLVVNVEAVGTAGTVLATMVWNTGAGSNQSTATSTANLLTLGEQKQTTQVIRVGAGTNITYSTTMSGATGTPQYRVSAIVEQLQ